MPILPKRLLAVGVGILSLPALGVVAYAAAHAVAVTPAPERVVPIDSRTRADDATDATDTAVNSEQRGRETEVGDDRGQDDTDVGDDHGGSSNSGSGSSNSGSGSSNSGSGSDDSGHRGGDG